MQKILYFVTTLALIIPSTIFAAGASPSVELKMAKNITVNTANIYGVISPGTAEDNGYWFEWGISGAEEVDAFKTNRIKISNKTGEKNVQAYIRGLSPETQYFFRLCADNQSTEVTGNTVYFTTKKLDDKAESVVVPTTRNVINIREESATIFGYVAPHNSSATYWFEYGTTESVDINTRTKFMNPSGGEVSYGFTNLTPGTIYYYRIAAENSRGVVYGSIKSFKTKGVKPTPELKSTTQTNKVDPKKTEDIADEGLISGFFGSNTKTAKTKTVSKTDNTASVASVNKNVVVTVKPIGTVGKNQTIEYKISYKYNNKEEGSDAQLNISIPNTVAYAGDTTSDELTVENGKNKDRIYSLPIGDIKKGDSRTISIIGILTSDVKKIPDVTAKLVFDTKSGKMTATSNTASVAKSTSSNLNFPTNGIVWFVCINLIIVAVILLVNLRDKYIAASLKVAEVNTKKDEIEKNIKDTLIAHHNSEAVQPHFELETTPVSPHNNPVPVKPKVFDISDIDDTALPGMEIVR